MSRIALFLQQLGNQDLILRHGVRRNGLDYIGTDASVRGESAGHDGGARRTAQGLHICEGSKQAYLSEMSQEIKLWFGTDQECMG